MELSSYLFLSASMGSLSAVKNLVKNPKVNLNYRQGSSTPLHVSCQVGRTEIVRFLLGLPGLNRTLLQPDGSSPLYVACQNGHVGVVELLLADGGFDVNGPINDGATPFYVACQNGHVDIIKLLLADTRVEVNRPTYSGTTPFSMACQKGLSEVVEILLADQRVFPHNLRENEPTPFYLACEEGRLKVVEMLLADPRTANDCNKPQQLNQTPFYIACHRKQKEVIARLLADPRIDVNAPKDSGITPFFIACYLGNEEIVALLLANERVDAARPRDMLITPLWNTSQQGHLRVVQYLLASGREVDTRAVSTFNNKTASQHARALGLRIKKDAKEAEEDFQRGKVNCVKIADLIDSFEKDPHVIRQQLRVQLGISEQWIEEHLGVQVSFGTNVTPVEGRKPAEVDTIYLTKKSLTFIPSNIVDFPNLTKIDLSHNPLDDGSTDGISRLLKSHRSLKSLDLTNSKIGPKGMLAILRALVRNYSQGHFSLESFGVDELQLDSFEGLGIIPNDILRLGSVRIVKYILDLNRSSLSDPLFRSKLMVVGSTEVGKTALIGCLFPLTGTFMIKEVIEKVSATDEVIWRDCYLKLVGNRLTQSGENRSSNRASDKKKAGHYFGTVYLSKKGWSIEIIDANQNFGGNEKHGFRLRGSNGFVTELYCVDANERDQWFTRIDELLKGDLTHGIDTHEIDLSSYPVVKSHLRDHHLKGKVELSVWDFAGRPGYFNSHQHFFSARSTFLVLWNVTEFDGKKDFPNAVEQGSLGKPQQGNGIQGLDFWLWSLSFHLDQQKKKGEEYFAVVVVGTHVDQLGETLRSEMGQRKSVVEQLCKKYGFGFGPGNYIEVSCVDNLVNINELQSLVLKETLGLKCMGEKIPLSYLSVEAYIGHLASLNTSYPIVDIQVILENFPDASLVRDALSLLHQWGRCAYYGNDERLRDQVVLDPHFLSKVTLAGLFRLGEEADEKRRGGVVCHSDLKTFWTSPPLANRDDFWEVAELLMPLLEKFDVCFVLPEDRGKPFVEQRSALSSLLPPRLNSEMAGIELSSLNGQMEAIRARIQELSAEYEAGKKLYDQKAMPKAEVSHFKSVDKDLKEMKKNLEGLEGQVQEIENQLEASQAWKSSWGDEPRTGQVVQFMRVIQLGSIPLELISRMLARLHGMIEDGCLSRDCVILRDENETQAKVAIDEVLGQFVVEIRAESLELGERMLDEIRKRTFKVAQRAKGEESGSGD